MTYLVTDRQTPILTSLKSALATLRTMSLVDSIPPTSGYRRYTPTDQVSSLISELRTEFQRAIVRIHPHLHQTPDTNRGT